MSVPSVRSRISNSQSLSAQRSQGKITFLSPMLLHVQKKERNPLTLRSSLSFFLDKSTLSPFPAAG